MTLNLNSVPKASDKVGGSGLKQHTHDASEDHPHQNTEKDHIHHENHTLHTTKAASPPEKFKAYIST